MSTHNSFNGKFGKEPGQQTVVVQCRHDVVNMRHRNSVLPDEKSDYHCHPTGSTYDQAINRIDRGNLVFSIGNTEFRGTLLDNAIPVVDQVNGMKRKKKRKENVDLSGEGNERRLAARLADDINVVGVTLGATVPNPESEEDQKNQITVRVHGTTNVFNNSKFSFAPGDTIIWEVPMPGENQKFPGGRDRAGRDPRASDVGAFPGYPRYGRAAMKYTLRVVPLRNADNTFYEHTITKVMHAGDKGSYKKAMTSKTSEFALLLKKAFAKMWWFSTQQNPTQDGFEGFWKNVEKVMKGENGGDDATKFQEVIKQVFKTQANSAQSPDIIVDLLAVFLQVQTDLRRRTLGKSFNYAKPGEMIGTLLGIA